MKNSMKSFLKITGVVALAMLVAGCALLGDKAEEAVVEAGEKAGVDIGVNTVDISALGGAGSITGLTIRNPEGYQTEYAFSMDEVGLNLKVSSLLFKPVTLSEFVLDSPVVNLEIKGPGQNNLKEIADVKKQYPDHAVVASLMVETKDEWQDIIKASEDAGADGLELNFGCPHGMSERGMGSAVGQVPEYTEMITSWVKEVARTPVLVKLTPNVTDIRPIAQAAVEGGADAISAINTYVGMAIDWRKRKPILGRGVGGLSGPCIKPLALRLVRQLYGAVDVPIIGIGGIQDADDAMEYFLAGASAIQVGTANFYRPTAVMDVLEGIPSRIAELGASSLQEIVGTLEDPA